MVGGMLVGVCVCVGCFFYFLWLKDVICYKCLSLVCNWLSYVGFI